MRYIVTVLHNCGPGLFFKLSEGDPLAEAVTLHLEGETPTAVCEDAWVVCNVDDATMLPPRLADHAEDVARYRARRNRSLSVADVVVLTDATGQVTFWAVANLGFTQVPVRELAWTADDPVQPYSAAYHAMMLWVR